MRIIEPVEIELDKKRSMILTMGALMAAEREINKLRALEPKRSVFHLIDQEIRGVKELDISADLMLVLLWASLLHEEPTLTVDAVGAMATDLRDVMVKVLQLIHNTFLSDESAEIAGDEAEKKTKARQTGRPSGASPASSLA